MERSMMMPERSRLGFYYYPDSLHYRSHDLERWLPELKTLGAGWLTLMAPVERAIPEDFINGLLQAGIEPLLHFAAPISAGYCDAVKDLLPLYARWGVNYVTLFDRPNCRESWGPAGWVQGDLVERFLDQFLPLAETAVEAGLIPVFPPLEPGGDYWDLCFIQTALESILRRGHERVLDKLVLSAEAWTGEHPPEWGAGGAQAWPHTRPYLTPADSQDHRGFHIFDWYLAAAQQAVNRRLPVILLRAGSRPSDHLNPQTLQSDSVAHARLNLEIACQICGEAGRAGTVQPVPAEVLACNFWLLAAGERDPWAVEAWFKADGSELPVVGAFRSWQARRGTAVAVEPVNEAQAADSAPAAQVESCHPIAHYVLLPLYAWGIPDWDLAVIQPLLQEAHPTVGFSLPEARLAKRVTVVGGEGAISEVALDMLRSAGCRVERVLEDGTLVAT
jgi:hypothetical protein